MKQRHINNQMLLIITNRLPIPKLLRSRLIRSSTHSELQHAPRQTLIPIQTTRHMTTQRRKALRSAFSSAVRGVLQSCCIAIFRHLLYSLSMSCLPFKGMMSGNRGSLQTVDANCAD